MKKSIIMPVVLSAVLSLNLCGCASTGGDSGERVRNFNAPFDVVVESARETFSDLHLKLNQAVMAPGEVKIKGKFEYGSNIYIKIINLDNESSMVKVSVGTGTEENNQSAEEFLDALGRYVICKN